MMVWMIASAILAAAWQNAAADGARQQLRTCIKQATETAKKQKLAVAGFQGFVHQNCATQEASFKSAVWAFDSKNKVSRKQSEADAKLQIEDFVSMASERYQMETTPR